MKDALVAILVIPVGLGGAYLWATPSSKANKKLVTGIVTYDIVAFALAYFVLKAF